MGFLYWAGLARVAPRLPEGAAVCSQRIRSSIWPAMTFFVNLTWNTLLRVRSRRQSVKKPGDLSGLSRVSIGDLGRLVVDTLVSQCAYRVVMLVLKHRGKLSYTLR